MATRRIWAAATVLAALSAPSLATEADLGIIRAECGAQLGLSASHCACIADAAGERLSDPQQALMVSQITKDEARARQLRGTMSIGEMEATGNFMASIVGECGG